jgi:hypothetical protein
MNETNYQGTAIWEKILSVLESMDGIKGDGQILE